MHPYEYLIAGYFSPCKATVPCYNVNTVATKQKPVGWNTEKTQGAVRMRIYSINRYAGLQRTLFLVASLVLLGACGEKTPPEQTEPKPVKIITFGKTQTEGYRTYPGKTDADQTADLAFENPGRLIELPVKRGQQVQKGELLARIDPLDFENAVAARKAEFIEAEADLNRYRQLYEEDAVSIADLQIRQKKFDVAKSNLGIAKKALRDTALKAPFPGVIARKFVDNFQDVQAKQPIVRLQDITTLEVIINIPERDIVNAPTIVTDKAAKAKITAHARFDTLPGKEFTLKLKEFETQADPKTQSFLVKFIMPNPEDINIAPGMTASVEIPSALLGETPESSLSVPASAIYFDPEGKRYVWVIDPSTMTVHRRRVVTGELNGKNIRIIDGLQRGEKIAATGVHHLNEGDTVRPYERLMEFPTR
jgi:RND family efflux transporter MFP subunit